MGTHGVVHIYIHTYYLMVGTSLLLSKDLPSIDWSTLGVSGGGVGEGIAILCSSDTVTLSIKEL